MVVVVRCNITVYDGTLNPLHDVQLDNKSNFSIEH